MSTKKPRPPRAKEANNKKIRKKTSVLTSEKVEYVDWKDVNLLRRFISDRAKIRSRRVSGNDVQQQRAVAMAIKNAREMALIPYANRVTTQRGARRGDRDRDDRRGERSEAPAEFEATEETTDVTEGVENEAPSTVVEETVAEAVAE